MAAETSCTSQPRIERAAAGDAAALAALAASSLTEAWSERGFAAELARPGARIWAARDPDGRLVGYLAAERVQGELLVHSLAVERDQRRRGTGRALLEQALAREPGVRVVHLEVRSNNAGAQAFYARVGFRAVGRRRGFYADGADAVLLTRAVPDGRTV
ncbi:MAG: GNAT family N-acetyltransferase [Myxococcota bacterium]